MCGRDREALMAMDGPLWSESRHPYPGIRAPNWVRLPLVLLGLTHASAVTRSSCIRCAPSPSCASNPLPSVAAGHRDAFPIRPLATHPRARLALGQTRPTIARYTALASPPPILGLRSGRVARDAAISVCLSPSALCRCTLTVLASLSCIQSQHLVW